ncbi:MAG TPA: hypothetical protein VGL89_00735 [Candidatus Koribacter sp.]
MTLSNGFSPATVNMPTTIVSESPEEVVRSAMPQGEEAGAGANVSEMNPNTPSPADFNFAAVAEASAFNTGFAGPSLGEIAKKYGKEHVQAHKTYTNDDIDQLTSSLGGDSGVIYARAANGQPIADRNQDGFSPMSGIANLPAAEGDQEGSQLANGNQANPMNEGQGNATASNQDQGQQNGEEATTPATNPATNGNANQQSLPASDNPR